jgi:hypothetical protein
LADAGIQDTSRDQYNTQYELLRDQIADFVGDAYYNGRTLLNTDTAVGGGLQKALELGVKTANFAAEVVNVKNFNANLPSRDAGTLGKTGMPFEPTDLIAKIHKGEMVLTPEQARKFMEGAKTDGLTSAVNEMAKSMPKLDIAKSIPQSVGTSTSAAPFKMPSMDQISFGPDGMPRITAKPQADAMANNVVAERKQQQTQRAAETAQAKSDQAQTTATQTSPAAQAAAGGKPATLDDVVKSLDNLNKNMHILVNTSTETNSLVSKQVKVAKSMSGNLFGAQ